MLEYKALAFIDKHWHQNRRIITSSVKVKHSGFMVDTSIQTPRRRHTFQAGELEECQKEWHQVGINCKNRYGKSVARTSLSGSSAATYANRDSRATMCPLPLNTEDHQIKQL